MVFCRVTKDFRNGFFTTGSSCSVLLATLLVKFVKLVNQDGREFGVKMVVKS